MTSSTTPGLRRRTLLQAAAGAAVLGAPPIIAARGEEPVKIGFIDPLTGSLSALAQTEVQGAKYATEEINKNGGILGRQVQLLVEDSANDVGTGVEKALKLINRDKVDVICADVNSAIAYAVAQVTNEHKIFHIVPGGHTDPITGTACKWNVFRICNTTTMDANAVSGELIKRFGKRWYFITPDYAYGHTLQDAFVRDLKKAGGEYAGDMLPIASTDFSASLIKAKAYKPNVLLNNMGGLAQIDCMKQFVQFGMDKEMALGGALFEVEIGCLGPAPGADGLVGHGMVVEPARGSACRRVQCRHQEDVQCTVRHCAALVRVCGDPHGAARGGGRQGSLGDQAGQGDRRHDAAARGSAAERKGDVPGGRSRADAGHLRRPDASAARRSGQRIHRREHSSG